LTITIYSQPTSNATKEQWHSLTLCDDDDDDGGVDNDKMWTALTGFKEITLKHRTKHGMFLTPINSA